MNIKLNHMGKNPMIGVSRLLFWIAKANKNQFKGIKNEHHHQIRFGHCAQHPCR